MAEDVIVRVRVETDASGNEQIVGGFQRIADSADAASASTGNLAENVRDNGGAMALLDTITGGYASQARDAWEATTLLGSGFSLARVQAVLFGTATRIALSATGIGAIVVALGLIIVYWEDILEAVTGVNQELVEQADTSAELADLALDRLDTTEKIDNQLRLSGKTEEEILNLKIKQLLVAIEARKLAIKERKEANEDVEKNIGRTEVLLARSGGLFSLVGRLIYGTKEERIAEREEGEKDADEGLEALLEKLAGFQIRAREIRQTSFEEALENDKELLDLEDDFWEADFERQKERDQKKLDQQAAINAELDALDDKLFKSFEKRNKDESDNELAWQKFTAEQKAEIILGTASNIAKALQQLSGENEDNARGFAVTSVIIDTAVAIMKAFGQLGPIGGAIAGVGIAALGIAQIHAITSAPKGGTGAITTPNTADIAVVGSGSGGEGIVDDSTPPPSFLGGATGGSDDLGNVIAGAINSRPLRAYVVSTDVTTQQELDRQTLDQATL